ncbi:MAG: tetratricopeptide repeat protein [Chloroflexi bacterium]|jgi:tetratricopeptide (TPR) repeat protein|nr:tetratricopeptide repeat protein [Chloroflexota bacterium]
MFRVTSLTSMDDRQLNKWIKRVVLILVAGTVLFTGFYFLDRWRAPATPIVDRRLSALEQAVRDNPEDVAARGLLADTYVAKGKFEEALVQYNAILETGKAEEQATYGRAGAYLALEQYDLAATDYERVVEIAKDGEMANVDPMLQASYYSLGSIAMKQAMPTEAIAHLEKALSIKRSDADALYLIGTAYVATGAMDKAETVLRGAVAFVPIGWSEPYAALADGFSKAGKTAMAEWAGAMADLAAGKPELAEPRLLAITDGEAALDAAIGLGLLYETKGDNAAASDWYGKALARSPDNAAARLGMSRVGPGASALPALPTPGTPAGGND